MWWNIRNQQQYLLTGKTQRIACISTLVAYSENQQQYLLKEKMLQEA